jgi:hypothetical protein
MGSIKIVHLYFEERKVLSLSWSGMPTDKEAVHSGGGSRWYNQVDGLDLLRKSRKEKENGMSILSIASRNPAYFTRTVRL